MNEANTKHLHENYPNLYGVHGRHRTYFECEDGWFPIIDKLSAKLEPMIIAYNLLYPENDCCFYASQVKEKYGALRFYMSCATEEMFKEIEQSELESEKTCEVCGKEGKLNSGPWYQTLCNEHMK